MNSALIVDDKEENRYFLRVLLGGHGFKVAEASHGAEALSMARTAPPDIVISDLLMPVLDGYALLRQWKADERLKPIPFVVYTATYTEPADERLALALGADAFIIKPCEPDPLMARIRAVLAAPHPAVPTSTAEAGAEAGALLQAHNEVLIRKLEKKAALLEQSNRELEEEIREKKRTEAALRDSEERYRSLFHAITDPLFVYDRETLAYLAVNDAAVAEYGYSRDELLAMTIADLRPPEDNPALLEMLARSGTGMQSRSTWRHRRKNGLLVDVEISAHPLDFAGRPACVVQARDISERKRLEDQLRQSQKMEAVGRLAGGVAHDFNNLLTIISGYSELLLANAAAGSRDGEFVRAICDAGEHAAALTRQLLAFSRQTMLQPEVLDLNIVVTRMGKMLGRLLGEDVVLATVLEPNLARVRVDPGQLDQVLMNLAVNARDAMPRGGRLEMETANVALTDINAHSHPECKPGPHVTLSITDTGCGMAPEILSRIFEPFFTTKEVGKGTGLGLPMVIGIVQQSGGCIHPFSEPGKGTTFKIYFPAVSDPLTQRSNLASPLLVSGSETILLVEDDEGVRGLTLRSLRMQGYEVITATDGEDAKRVLAAHRGTINLLLTDVVMPNVSGPELAVIVRAQFPSMKVLFLSGYTADAMVRHGLREAEVAFLQKPYTPQSLAQKVRQVLGD